VPQFDDQESNHFLHRDPPRWQMSIIETKTRRSSTSSSLWNSAVALTGSLILPAQPEPYEEAAGCADAPGDVGTPTPRRSRVRSAADRPYPIRCELSKPTRRFTTLEKQRGRSSNSISAPRRSDFEPPNAKAVANYLGIERATANKVLANVRAGVRYLNPRQTKRTYRLRAKGFEVRIHNSP
jgi:hypothetical protein